MMNGITPNEVQGTSNEAIEFKTPDAHQRMQLVDIVTQKFNLQKYPSKTTQNAQKR